MRRVVAFRMWGPGADQGSPRKYPVLVELGESEPVPEDVVDRREALKQFINGFAPSALKAQGCS